MRSLFSSQTRSFPVRARDARRPGRSAVRLNPAFEPLEDRRVPAIVTVAGSLDGSTAVQMAGQSDSDADSHDVTSCESASPAAPTPAVGRKRITKATATLGVCASLSL
jgi:hypothetical protein